MLTTSKSLCSHETKRFSFLRSIVPTHVFLMSLRSTSQRKGNITVPPGVDPPVAHRLVFTILGRDPNSKVVLPAINTAIWFN